MSHEDIHGCRFAVDGKPCGKSADWVAQGGEYPLYVELCAKHYDKLDEEPAGWKERTFQRTKVEVDCTFCDLGQAYPSGPYAPHSPTCPLMRDPLLRKINQEVNRAHGDFLNGPREGECDLDTSAPAAAGGGSQPAGGTDALAQPSKDAGGESDREWEIRCACQAFYMLAQDNPEDFTPEVLRKFVLDLMGDEPEWDDRPDEWTEAVKAAFPTRSGSHDEYALAMKMVGSRNAKGELVALVNWLLVRLSRATGSLGRSASYAPVKEDVKGEVGSGRSDECLRCGAPLGVLGTYCTDDAACREREALIRKACNLPPR